MTRRQRVWWIATLVRVGRLATWMRSSLER